MAGDAKKRQKRLEKKTARRKEKRHDLVRTKNVGLAQRLAAAAQFPVLRAWIGGSGRDDGIASAHLSRLTPTGEVAIATFLVDSYCLGVKDAFSTIIHRTEYETQFVPQATQGLAAVRAVAPAELRKFVEGAAAYAQSLGLAAHPSYETAKLLFGDLNPAESNAEFTFGQDGKPLYVAGPYDSPARIREVLAILAHTRGMGNFDYRLPLAKQEFSLEKEVGTKESRADEVRG